MVKVVGQDHSVTKRATCKHCGAVNEYLPNEVRELYRGKDMSGCGEGQDGFNCGQCGNQVITRSW